MARTISFNEAQESIHIMLEEDTPLDDMVAYLTENGLSESQIRRLLNKVMRPEKLKHEDKPMTQQQTTLVQNPLEGFFASVLNLGITYGVPLVLFMFGASYVGNELANDINVGVRSLAAVLLPLTLAFTISKSDIGVSASNLLSSNRFISFGFSFAFAMLTAAIAMYMRPEGNIIPIGELAFSTTLSLMVFGNRQLNNELSFLHIGAVCGFLTFIILFGIPV